MAGSWVMRPRSNATCGKPCTATPSVKRISPCSTSATTPSRRPTASRSRTGSTATRSDSRVDAPVSDDHAPSRRSSVSAPRPDRAPYRERDVPGAAWRGGLDLRGGSQGTPMKAPPNGPRSCVSVRASSSLWRRPSRPASRIRSMPGSSFPTPRIAFARSSTDFADLCGGSLHGSSTDSATSRSRTFAMSHAASDRGNEMEPCRFARTAALLSERDAAPWVSWPIEHKNPPDGRNKEST